LLLAGGLLLLLRRRRRLLHCRLHCRRRLLLLLLGQGSSCRLLRCCLRLAHPAGGSHGRHISEQGRGRHHTCSTNPGH
jgi:hypothetical protein